MLTLRVNDAAADSLALLSAPPGGLAPGLRELAGAGIVQCGEVVVLAKDAAKAAGAPGIFADLSYWEGQVSSFHPDDVAPVTVSTSDDHEPVISEDDQRLMLAHGLAFAYEVARLGRAAEPPLPLRCIVGANTTNGTFRFHRVRVGQDRLVSDLDSDEHDKLIVVETLP